MLLAPKALLEVLLERVKGASLVQMGLQATLVALGLLELLEPLA